MSDLGVALSALSDDDLRAAIRDATAGRPALAAIHDAASVEGSAARNDPEPVEAAPVEVEPGVAESGVADPGEAEVVDAELVDEPAVDPAPPIVAPPPDYTDAGVPTMTGVREKVGRAIGAAELERESPHGKSLEQQWEERRAAGRERLEQIRRSMKGDA